MALASYETFDRGFVRFVADGSLVVTGNITGATFKQGYLRDVDGRLVVLNG